MDTFLELFSVIGAFSLAFEMAGFTCVEHCEIDKYANLSYNAMHQPKESEWFEKDITKINPQHHQIALFGQEVSPAKTYLQQALGSDFVEIEVDCFLISLDCSDASTPITIKA